MRSLLVTVAVAAVALGACTPKKEAPADPAATASTPGATPAPSDPRAPAVDGAATLKAPATTTAGANVPVEWTGPANSGDYIDIVPRGNTATTGELSYVYVKNASGPVATVRAPTSAGEYDIRYVLDMAGARTIKATAALSVTAGAATLSAPASAEAGQALEVSWTGPNGPGDYIDLVKAGVKETSGEITYAYTSAGNPAKIEAPSAAGDYEIRYVLEGPGGRKVPVTTPLKVTSPKATLNAPATASKGKPFKVEWTGPKSSGDYVDLVHKGTVATSGETSYFYVTVGTTGELTAPEAGDYEIRYVLEAPGGRAVLASRPVSVR